MIWALYGCLAALMVAGVLVLFRLERGPGNLDRVVALDVITSASVGVVVVVMAISGRIDLLPLLVILTSVGFIGSTVVARFSQAESIGERRILTAQEAAREPEAVSADAASPAHPAAGERAGDAASPPAGPRPGRGPARDEAPPGDRAGGRR